jgi:FdhE protein
VKVKGSPEESNVPINPISRLLHPGGTRRKPLRPDVEQALTQLTQLAEQQADLAALAATHAALLRVAFRDTPPVPNISIDTVYAATKLEGGVPLLRGEQLALDTAWLREQYLQLCDALIDLPKESSDVSSRSAAATLRQAVKRDALDIHALTMDVLAGDPYAVVQQATQLDLDATLAATLLRWTLLPILEQVAKQLQPLRQHVLWEKGYCPTCGAWPLLAERRGIEQKLFLRCGLCASEWQIEHMFCPFCTSRNHLDIGYFYDEAQQATQRAVTCERCHCYYKSVTTLAPIPTPQLFVTDLVTVHLDLIALERAYGPPP